MHTLGTTATTEAETTALSGRGRRLKRLFGSAATIAALGIGGLAFGAGSAAAMPIDETRSDCQGSGGSWTRITIYGSDYVDRWYACTWRADGVRFEWDVNGKFRRECVQSARGTWRCSG